MKSGKIPPVEMSAKTVAIHESQKFTPNAVNITLYILAGSSSDSMSDLIGYYGATVRSSVQGD